MATKKTECARCFAESGGECEYHWGVKMLEKMSAALEEVLVLRKQLEKANAEISRLKAGQNKKRK